MARQFGFGQAITSYLPVTGAIDAAGNALASNAGIAIVGAAAMDDPEAPLYARDGETLVFSAPGIAAYRCTTSGITVTPYTNADLSEIEALLIATALPVVMWMQGKYVLHAAGLLMPGASCMLAIAGASGIGKSTIAAQLLDRGARLVGDDSLALTADGDGWQACGLPGGTFLPRGGDREFRPVGAGKACLAAPFGALLILSGSTDGLAGLEALGAVSGLEQVLANQHRPRVPVALGSRPLALAQASRIAATVPILRWKRPRGQIELSETECEHLAAL